MTSEAPCPPTGAACRASRCCAHPPALCLAAVCSAPCVNNAEQQCARFLRQSTQYVMAQCSKVQVVAEHAVLRGNCLVAWRAALSRHSAANFSRILHLLAARCSHGMGN
jgi:hypothetical protein